MINCFFLILINTIFFSCNLYPRHIIESNSGFFVIGILFNLLYFIIYFMFIIIAFYDNKQLFSDEIFYSLKKNFNKFKIKKFSVLIAIQVVFDIINIFIFYVADEYGYYFLELIILVQWVLLYCLCVKKENSIFKKPKLAIIIISLFITFFIIVTLFNNVLIDEYTNLSKKYEINCVYFSSQINNLDFLLSLNIYFFDTIIGLILMIFHGIFNHCFFKKERKRYIKLIIRSSLLIFSCFIMISCKTLFFPICCIKDFSIDFTNESNYTETNKFYSNTKIITIKRINKNFQPYVVFQTTEDSLYYDGKYIKTFLSNDGKKATSYEINGNQIIVNDCFDEYIIDDKVVYIYKNHAICFIENDNPVIITFEEIQNQKNNPIIIGVCEQLLERGNIEIFEYCYKYLQKYDNSFINDYVKRYKESSFSYDELQRLDFIGVKKSYLKSILIEAEPSA